MSRKTFAELNLAALAHNFQRCRQLAPASKVLAVLKANAYGHGMERVAQNLPEAAGFAVATVEEAMRLRRVTDKMILLLEGVGSAEELTLAEELRLTQVVHSMRQLELLVRAKETRNPLKVWLKVDTGMHRLGFNRKDAFDVWHTLHHLAQVDSEIVLMSHLANADNPDDDRSTLQIERFEAIVGRLGATSTSLANSAGICAWPSSHARWVRPGLMLYGASPMINRSAQQLGLQPVLTLRSSLLAINELKAGDHIGYGGRYCCAKDMRVAVVGIGYGDGYPRNAKDGTKVLVTGRACPLVGRVSMDMLTVDITALPDAQIGDSVTLWGKGLPIEDVAAAAGSISYELLCGITERVPTKLVQATPGI